MTLRISIKKDEERYYRNVFYLLISHINISEQNIFHFNYLHHAPLAKLLKLKYINCYTILTIHYLDWCFELKGNRTSFRSILSKNLEQRNDKETAIYEQYIRDKSFFIEIDKIICLSYYTQRLLCEDYLIPEKKTTVIYNKLKDEATLLNDAERQKLKASLLFQKKEKVVLFVGRLDEIKGLAFLTKSFRKVLNSIPEAHLVIIGDGDYNLYFTECKDIWRKVTFTGKVEKDKLYDFYQIADVGVMPSFHEQCSYVAIEMMMHGVPLIGTTSTGLREMICENHNTLVHLYESETEITFPTEKLADSIINILSDNHVRELSRKKYLLDYHLNDVNIIFKSYYEK